jgi:NADPH-dependent 2,4-dienoyl-CoA reductase/sulfur reductase-like enzyme
VRLLVIGGDAAGMTAASSVRRERPDAEVVVVDRGSWTSYSMCGIPAYVGGEVARAEDLVARTPEQFAAMGITVHLRTEALAVDSAARRVWVRDLETGAERDEPYDALLLATGAHPKLPPLPGLAEYGHVLHTLDEGTHLRAHLEDPRRDLQRVLIVGAGYIGLEVAEALVARGMKATLLDRSPQVMKSLDADMAAHVQARMEEFGITVRLGESLLEVRGADGVCKEVVTDRGTYPADTVVLAMGGRPNVALAVSAGCEIGPSGGVVVDPGMRTTVPGIWAAGDLVESRDLVAGLRVNVQLGTHANRQGKIAGITIAGGEAAFPGVVGTAITKLCRWEIGRTGLTEAEARRAGIDHVAVSFTGTARAGYMPDPGHVHVKMLAERGSGRVLGCQLVGTGNVAKRIDVAAVWVQLRVPVNEAQLHDLSYAPPFGGVWDLLQVAARKLTRELGLAPAL